jgi:hypothetical protein
MIQRALGPDLPSVPMDDALNGRQSYTGTFKFFGRMQSLKDTEKLMDISHIKAGTIIPHEQLRTGWSICATDLDLGWRS